MLCTSGSDVGGDAASDGSDVGGSGSSSGGVGVVSRRVRSSQASEPMTAPATAAATTSTSTSTSTALLAFDVDGTLAASIAVLAERRRRRDACVLSLAKVSCYDCNY